MNKGFNHKSFNNKGFTLAELLIVVAIIAVLVAISIPILSKQLEKSREATDLANVRSAYAEVMAAAITEDTTSALYQSDGTYKAVVSLKQKQAGWQSKLPITIGGVTSESTAGGTAPDPSHWVGQPGTTCTVSYSQSDGIVFTWDGESSGSSEEPSASTSYSIDNFGGIATGAWNSSGEAKNNGYVSRRSTKSLIELEPNSTYTLTYTVPAEYTSQGVEIGTLLFTESNGTTSIKGQRINNTTQQASSGWVSGTVNNGTAAQNYQTVTTNSDGSKTITQTINTDADNVWFGANFCVASNVNLTKNPTELAAVTAALNSLKLTKN